MAKASRKKSRSRERKTRAAAWVFVRERAEVVRGREVRRYYACLREGTPRRGFRDEVLVRISKRRYDAHRMASRRVEERRGQKHERRLQNGETVTVKGAGHCWPLKCEALAVHPSQVQELTAHNKRHGVNVTYDPKWGTAIVPDAGEYRKFKRLYGVHDRNSFSG